VAVEKGEKKKMGGDAESIGKEKAAARAGKSKVNLI